MGIYYFVAADDAQKEKIREIVTDMSNWAHLKNNMVVLRELKPLADWSVGVGDSLITGTELKHLRSLLREFPIRDLRVDRANPDVWYGLMETGVAVTEDAGNSWRVSRKGLDILRVNAIWTPRYYQLVMVGTPAGMYVSNNQGKSWTDTPLIFQQGGTIRTEIGGIGYLTAYWMGRYHGFVSEEEAHAEWWKEYPNR